MPDTDPAATIPDATAGTAASDVASADTLSRAADAVLELVAGSDYDVAIEPPGRGEGYWAGGPSAVHDGDAFYLAYRLRKPVSEGRGFANVVARSSDGVHFETVATVTSEQFGAASLERPALVPLLDGGWRLYVSCSSWNSKHWWVEALDAERPEDLAAGHRTVVLPGDETQAWKDIVVHHSEGSWQMWACRHPLDGGDDEADRMTTVYLTSDDGLAWGEVGTALAPTPGTWEQRGTRVTSVLPIGARPGSSPAWLAFFDGRADKTQNWFERTGYATGSDPARLTATAGPTPEDETIRYLSVAVDGDGLRVYWEASRPDGANELRTVYAPPPVSDSQS